MPFPEITTDRLVLRSFCPADLSDLQEILGDPLTMEHLEPPYGPEKTRRFLQEFCIRRQGALAAVLQSSGKLIGYLLFSQLEPQVYEIGWAFHRAYWRQGYACEACRALIGHAFASHAARRIFAETTDPVKSVGLMKKLGMRPQTGPDASPRAGGSGERSMYCYELTAESYHALPE